MTNRKLTPEIAEAIRYMESKGNMPRGWKARMARSLGVARSVISDILSGRRWKRNET